MGQQLPKFTIRFTRRTAGCQKAKWLWPLSGLPLRWVTMAQSLLPLLIILNMVRVNPTRRLIDWPPFPPINLSLLIKSRAPLEENQIVEKDNNIDDERRRDEEYEVLQKDMVELQKKMHIIR